MSRHILNLGERRSSEVAPERGFPAHPPGGARFGLSCLAALVTAMAGEAGPDLDVSRRWDRSELEATRSARLRFARERVTLPEHGLWVDVRGAFVRIPDTAGDPAPADRLVEAARRAGVRVLIPVVREPSALGAWRGMREGVLVVPGIERADGTLWLPESGAEGNQRLDGGLGFLLQGATNPAGSTQALVGIEVAGRGFDLSPEGAKPGVMAAPEPGHWREFPDETFGATAAARPDLLARWDRELGDRPLTGMAVIDLPSGAGIAELALGGWEAALRQVSTHLLVTEITEPAVRAALAEGRAYVAHDWLCDPTGFVFGAVNNLGVFPMGDGAPLLGKTRVTALSPVAGRLKLIHGGWVIHETTGTNLTQEIGAFGAYRIEVWLSVAGRERPWIYSNPIRLRAPVLADMRLPSNELASHAEVERDLLYTEGKPEEAAKQKLDIYRPKGATRAPVFFFVHGGAWKYGDRNQYTPLGNRYTKEGFVTVVPSYRLAPGSPFPAQIEDVAAAFAWTLRHIAEWGGDTNRMFVGGHSAGGHLAALLVLDRSRLAPWALSPDAVRGVVALSGVYDLTALDALSSVFGDNPALRRKASPLCHIRPDAPRFLITYCQWDYFSLPSQARALDAALRQAGVGSELVYVPAQNHISEMLNVGAVDDPTVAAVLSFMRR